MPNLLLIPTEFERGKLEPLLAATATQHGWEIALSGFGPIAAASRTAMLIAQHQPKVVCLIGIAGGFDGRGVAIGQATQFDSVACDNIGVGSGADYRSAAELGWSMIEDTDPEIDDIIFLRSSVTERCLLTVCAASANASEANARAKKFPDVIAEDMEGFGVAMSCQLAGVQLRIVRGISNLVGDRDNDKWQVETALAAAAELAIENVIEEA
ncbi:MAG: futalosine hydrolase [Pirellulaceae bacterium]